MRNLVMIEVDGRHYVQDADTKKTLWREQVVAVVHRKKSSKYKCVYLDRRTGKWRSYIYFGGKVIQLGYFETEFEAAVEYNRHAKKHGKPQINIDTPVIKHNPPARLDVFWDEKQSRKIQQHEKD